MATRLDISTRIDEGLETNLELEMAEVRCARHKYTQAMTAVQFTDICTQAMTAVQQTQARAAMQHAHARHMQDTRTQARAAMQHTHVHTHARHTHTSEGRCATHKYSQARAAVQHTLTSDDRSLHTRDDLFAHKR